jgi:hypothetical protein
MDAKDLFVTIVFLALFYGIYQIILLLTNYFLKRSIIRTGHFDRAEILSQGLIVAAEAETNTEPNKYPSLKWGLVVFMAGVGLVLITLLGLDRPVMNLYYPVLPIGIELMSISAGFLIYFVIASYKSKTK